MSTDIAIQEQSRDDVAIAKRSHYSSLQGSDFETRKMVLRSLTNATPLQENLNTPIPVRHIVRVPGESVNEITGELEHYTRTVLITEDGTAYSASSKGIDNSFAAIIASIGEPNKWPEPVYFVATREGQGTAKYLTLKLAD